MGNEVTVNVSYEQIGILYDCYLREMVNGSLASFPGTLYLVGVDKVRMARSNVVQVQSGSIDYSWGYFEGESTLKIVDARGETAVCFHPVANLDRMLWGARTDGHTPPQYELAAMIGGRIQLLALNNWVTSDGKTIKVNFEGKGGAVATDRVYVRSKLASVSNGIGLGVPPKWELVTTMMKVGLYLGEKAEREGAALFLPVGLKREGPQLERKAFGNYGGAGIARAQCRMHNEAVQKKINKLKEELRGEKDNEANALSLAREITRLESLICEDALMPQPDGKISEGTGENLFLVVKRGDEQVLVTPNVVEGRCLPGITRAITLELAREGSIQMDEAMFTLPEKVLKQVELIPRKNGNNNSVIDMSGGEVLSAFMSGNYAGLVCFTRVIIPKYHYDEKGGKVFDGDGEIVRVGVEGTSNKIFTELKRVYGEVQAGKRMPWLMEDIRGWLTPKEIRELNQKGREIVRAHAKADQLLEKGLKEEGLTRAVGDLEFQVALKARPRDAQAFLQRVEMQRQTIARGFQTVGLKGFARR